MKLEIRSKTLTGWETEIWIDGNRATDIQSLTLSLSAEGLNQATVTRLVDDLEVDAEVLRALTATQAAAVMSAATEKAEGSSCA